MKIIYVIVLTSIISSCFESNSIDEDSILIIEWAHSIDAVDAPSAPPIVVDDNLLIYSGEIALVALEIETGNIKWKGEIDGKNSLEANQILFDGNKIVSNQIKDVIGWNVTTGEKIFHKDEMDGISVFRIGKNSITDNGYAFVGDTLDLYVLDRNGNILYTKDISMSTAGVSYFEEKLFLGQRKTVHGALTLGRIVALNAQTGDSLWAFDTDQGGFTWTAPIIEDGILYASTIGNSDGEIAIALNAETGVELWRQTEEIFTFNSALGPKHFYINTSGSLAALDKETGIIDWRVDWEGSDFNKPVYLEGYVYHVRDGEIMVIDDKTGEVVHREPVPDGTFFWHVAASSHKIFAQTSRQLIAYQPWHLRD